MTKTLAVLGSTGSIGVQALEVAKLSGFEVVALTANSRTDIIEEQIREFNPRVVAVADEKAAADLKIRVADTNTKVLSGAEGVKECAACGADTVLNSIVGIAGLAPTLAAIEKGSKIALANKETLVAGGKIVMDTAAEKGVDILPVFVHRKDNTPKLFRKTTVILGKPIKFSELGYDPEKSGEYARIVGIVFDEVCKLGEAFEKCQK